MSCDAIFLGLCLARVPAETGDPIFGFSEFLTALALLVLVFSTSEFVYRFRALVAPIPLLPASFLAAVVIAGGTLLNDIWFADRWYSLRWGVTRAEIQVGLGASFLAVVLLWIAVAYMWPPRFGRWNAKRYYRAVYRAIVRGSDLQLAALAAEIVPSARRLIELSTVRRRSEYDARRPEVGDYATWVLIALGNRKFCRHVVASSPVTAIALMEEAARQKRYHVPLSMFAHNVMNEALRNRDSILFHEDRYASDVLGRTRPFSRAMFGCFPLVEELGNSGAHSPLDVDWRLAREMDGEQFEAFCRCVQLTFDGYLDGGAYWNHSYALHRAFGRVGEAGSELYKLDKTIGSSWTSEPAGRLRAAVDLVDGAIKSIEKRADIEFGVLRSRKGKYGADHTIFDKLAETMLELLLSASSVREPLETAWWIQHNEVWSRFFGLRQRSKAWDVIRFKFSRLVFDEIIRLETFPNYKGARLLGICLNVLGLTADPKDRYRAGEGPLHRAILRWTRRNYLGLVAAHPPVAKFCMMGGITFDPKGRRLVKTYLMGFGLKPDREYLSLEPATSSAAANTRGLARKPRGVSARARTPSKAR